VTAETSMPEFGDTKTRAQVTLIAFGTKMVCARQVDISHF